MITILVFIGVLGVLVLAHELGHFISAKKSGVKVEEFGFGLPPRIWGKKGKDGIIYSLNWIPIGGFVKLKGEDSSSDNDADSFANQSGRKRAIILSAGVIMNVILAYVLFSVGYMFGLPTAVDENNLQDSKISNVKVQIAGVVKDSPAMASGIKVGDTVLAINGQPLPTVSAMQNFIKDHQNETLSLTIERNGQELALAAMPQPISGFSEGRVLGINLQQTATMRYGFWSSWYQGLLATWNVLVMIVLAFYNLFKNLIIGLGLTVDLSGPVGVAVMTGQVVSLGWTYVLQFIALLSLNLAVINFLPFPGLDGGRFLFLIIEKIRRKRNNQKIESIIHGIGFSLLLLLFAVVTYRDVVRYGGGLISKIINWF